MICSSGLQYYNASSHRTSRPIFEVTGPVSKLSADKFSELACSFTTLVTHYAIGTYGNRAEIGDIFLMKLLFCNLPDGNC